MIQYLYLGRVAYDEALRLQAEIAALRLDGRVENVLLLLEHPPVLTLGRNANRSNVLASDELLASRGVTLHEINRGGDVTYHGPGQLVGYPIFDLRSLQNSNAGALNDGSSLSGSRGARLGPVDFVRRMEEVLIRLCGVYGVRAGTHHRPHRRLVRTPYPATAVVQRVAPRGGAQDWRYRHSRFARHHFARLRLQRHDRPS